MPDSPPSLGPFRVTGRRAESPAGTVLDGHSQDGTPVTLVLLAAGPGTDAASRDRFAAAVDRARRDGEVVLQDTTAAHPWVALRAGSERAGSLLGAVLPAGAVGTAVAGPVFEPHWRTAHGGWSPRPAGSTPHPVSQHGGAADGSTGRWVAAAVVAVLAMAVAGFVGWRALLGGTVPGADPNPAATSVLPQPDAQPQPQPQPEPQPQQPGPTPQGPQPGVPAPPGAPSQPLETTGPGVAGPSFTPDDATTEMRLADLPFPFRVPSTWDCRRVAEVAEPVVRYLCIDRDDPGDTDPAGGIIDVRPCPQPCDQRAWEALRTEIAPQALWRPVDAQTAIAEDVPVEPPGTYRLRMSRVFAATAGAAVDTHVFVEMTGGPQDVSAVQKVVNDIRANTP